MNTTIAYCSARDQDVRIAWLESSPDGQTQLVEPEVVCLDYGEKCTGALCPSFGLPSMLMGVRLARSGLPTAPWRTVYAACGECGQVSDLRVVNADYLYCGVCGSTLRWRQIEADGDSYLALACVG
jgi:hypothetical protein